MIADQFNLKWLENPNIFQVNRQDAHSDHIFFSSEETMRRGDKTLYQSLNGTWKFCWSPSPLKRPERFYASGYDDAGWDTILVPGHIELQGYGQIQYVNTMYPWDGHSYLRPPKIDWEHTPVGSYIRMFDLNDELRGGKRVCISFQGAEQALVVWLNGHFVGYSEDSFTPSDFDLSPWIQETENRLCVEVYKHSSASWLEDQDFFRFSGLFRDVYLYAKPEWHIEDLWFKTHLCEDNVSGTLSIRLKVSSNSYIFPTKKLVRLRLFAPDGTLVLEGCPKFKSENNYSISESFAITSVLAWSNSTPHIYRAELALFQPSGQICEWTYYNIGFRRVEIKDGIILLNGKRLLLNGVNRHEWNPERGRSITEQDQYAAIDVLKRNNINAVRTSHYPNQSLWYTLCDKNGIYLMDETNLESHGSWQKMGKCDPSWNIPANLPEWRDCVVDRARAMFERDKNHPSILFWSCGNESYAGEDILAIAQFFRENDPYRLVHYEGVFWNREYDSISDIESRMYAPPYKIREYLINHPQKPFILCEYMHDMGNSLGGMESYIQLAEEYPNFQGGFLWDYMDQALWRKDALGRMTLGYGGDFSERPTDYAFSANGIMFADGTEKPAMQDVKYWYSTSEQRKQQDTTNANLAKQSYEYIEQEHLHLNEQLSAMPELQVCEGDVNLGVKGNDFEILFSYSEGGPVSLQIGSTEWLYRPPRPAFWRAATENDKGNGFFQKSSIWMAAEAASYCTEWKILEKTKRKVCISYRYAIPVLDGVIVNLVYCIDCAGRLKVTAMYQGIPHAPQLPEFGIRFSTPAPASRIRWQGLSGETYPDRMRGGRFGWHTETPHIASYLVPQESGCHIGTHRVELYSNTTLPSQLAKLRLVMSEKPFAFSAIPYTPLELESATHQEELPDTGRTVISILGAMRGVGGINSWGEDVEPRFRLEGTLDWNVSLFILCSGDNPEQI